MFEEMTFEAIIEEMMEDMPNGIDTSEGSLIYNACAKQAARLEQAYIDLGAVADNQYPDTADLDHLIKFGQERGIYINDATAAEFEGQFNVEVPIGTEFSGDDYNYIVTELISDAEHKYRLECEDAGVEANGWLGELMCLDDVEGLEDAALTKLLVEGQEEEDEESYRMRLLESFETKPYAGNRKYYIQEIDAIDGVGGAKLERAVNGEDITATIIAEDYSKPSTEFVKKVQEMVDPNEESGNGFGIAPIGHAVHIEGVTSVKINIKLNITCEDGYTTEGLKKQIEDVIENYLLNLRKQWEQTNQMRIRKARIENDIYTIEGVEDINTCILNDREGAQTIVLDANQIPIKGEITCN